MTRTQGRILITLGAVLVLAIGGVLAVVLLRGPAATPAPTSTAADSGITECQYVAGMRLLTSQGQHDGIRLQFANSRNADLRKLGTGWIDALWTYDNSPGMLDTDLGASTYASEESLRGQLSSTCTALTGHP